MNELTGSVGVGAGLVRPMDMGPIKRLADEFHAKYRHVQPATLAAVFRQFVGAREIPTNEQIELRNILCHTYKMPLVVQIIEIGPVETPISSTAKPKHAASAETDTLKQETWQNTKGKRLQFRRPYSPSRTAVQKVEAKEVQERFFDNTTSSGLYGGSGGVAGGSVNSEYPKMPPSGFSPSMSSTMTCPKCGSPFMITLAGGGLLCSNCGYSVAPQGVGGTIKSQMGSNGVKNSGNVGYIRVPGGAFETNEKHEGRLIVDYLGNNQFKLGFGSVEQTFNLEQANDVMNFKLRSLGLNQNIMREELVDWLYKAKPGQQYIWDMVNHTRIECDKKGFRKHSQYSGY